jgi:hypothetical protein
VCISAGRGSSDANRHSTAYGCNANVMNANARMTHANMTDAGSTTTTCEGVT